MHGWSPSIKCFVPTCENSATLLGSSVDALGQDAGVKPHLLWLIARPAKITLTPLCIALSEWPGLRKQGSTETSGVFALA